MNRSRSNSKHRTSKFYPETINSDSSKNDDLVIVKDGHCRKLNPAKNYDVLSFARAMNPDIGQRVQKLFEVEKEAAIEATESGVYVSWRCPDQQWDCQRVAMSSLCFCGHKLLDHKLNLKKMQSTPCSSTGCLCKTFSWVPSRPEEIGEFWQRRRKNFEPEKWRVTCKCKHNHEQHEPKGFKKCKKCPCSSFKSNFLCAACDKHWENHETFIETAAERKQQNLTTGQDFLPFSEMPSLRNMVLTGKDDGDTSYFKKQGKLQSGFISKEIEQEANRGNQDL